MSLRPRLALLLAATSLLLTGCSGPEAEPTTPAPTTPLTATNRVSDPPKYTGSLLDVALPVPDGATRESLAVANEDGTIDQDGVAAEYDNPDAVWDVLEELEFERGVFLAWTEANGVLVYLSLYQFHYPVGSAKWFAWEADGLQAIAEREISIPVEYARGYRTITPNGRTGLHARFVRGDFAVMVSTFTHGEGDLAYLQQLAADQFERLPAAP